MTRMSLLAIAMMFALGCANDPARTAADDIQTDASAAAAGFAASGSCPEPTYSATPAGVTVYHRYFVRSDPLCSTRIGVERRRTALELLSGDARQAAAALAGYLARGFRQIDVPDRDDGAARYAVRRSGVGRINISATDDIGAKPSHPRSVGVVAFDLPLTSHGVDHSTGDVDGTGITEPSGS